MVVRQKRLYNCLLACTCMCCTSHTQLANVGLEKELLHVTAGHVAAQKRFIYTNKDGLIEAPSGFSWVFTTKPPFTKPLLGMQEYTLDRYSVVHVAYQPSFHTLHAEKSGWNGGYSQL